MGYKKATSYDELPTVRFGDQEGELGVGEPLEGYYKGARTAKTKYGEKLVHIIQTENGDVQTWGSSDLDRKLEQVKPGSKVLIEFVEFKAPKKRGRSPTKIVDVQYDDEDIIEVEVPKVSFSSEEDDNDDDSSDDDQDQDDQEEQEEETPPARSAATSKKTSAPAAKPAANSKANASTTAATKAKLDAMLNKQRSRAST